MVPGGRGVPFLRGASSTQAEAMNIWLAILSRGGIGSLMRYGIRVSCWPGGERRFPWATLVSNGDAIVHRVDASQPVSALGERPAMKAFIAVGICGFTARSRSATRASAHPRGMPGWRVDQHRGERSPACRSSSSHATHDNFPGPRSIFLCAGLVVRFALQAQQPCVTTRRSP